MFNKFNSSSNHESHRDVKPSSYLTHLHTQAFRKISQLVIFKLSSCDSSHTLELVTGESLNVHKMSYTHPNSIFSIYMGSRRWEEEMGKDPFWYFLVTNCGLSTSSPISQKWNILISTRPIVKLKIVLEILRSRKDMVKNPFSDFEFFTSINPCDSSPPPRRNHELGTSEKFLKHGFSFFNPNLPLSLKTRSKCHIGWLFYKNP